VTSNQLHVPVDRQLDITLSSLDVVHSFWVPEWRIKRDAVPAGGSGDEIDDEFVVTPDQEGTYALICTELCGTGHSTMRASVVVESQQDFDRWIDEQTRAQQQATSGGGTAASGGSSASSQSGT
jgi:cytochrome c oxidase subunit II